MTNKTITILVVVAAGIFLGVLIVFTQSRQDLFRILVQQNSEILRLQHQMAGGGPENLKNLEERVAKLETQWKKLEGIFEPPAGDFGQDFQQPSVNTTVHDIDMGHSIVRGNPEAPVTIVEFLDFQCPFCARFHDPVLEVMKNYPQEVKYVLKNYPLPFHPQAKPAAKAAFAAGEQGKYHEMVDALLGNNQRLSDETFKELAGNLGLDVEKFMADYKEKDAQWEQYLQEDLNLVNKIGVQGTPTFYINGRETIARDFQGFKKEIDSILKGE